MVNAAPRWPPATSEGSDRAHTCDVAALSGPYIVYQYDDDKTIPHDIERKKMCWHAHRPLLHEPILPLRNGSDVNNNVIIKVSLSVRMRVSHRVTARCLLYDDHDKNSA